MDLGCDVLAALVDEVRGVLKLLLDLNLGRQLDGVLLLLLTSDLVRALVNDVGVVGDAPTVPGKDL